jgi:L-asparaginase
MSGGEPTAEGVSPALDGQALVAAVPGLASIEGLTVRSLLNRSSSSLTTAEALLIARSACEEAATGRGVVVTHGTDTLEEVAFLCDLIHGGETPIVFTGAMRAASAPSADGPANLLDAAFVAATRETAGLGVLVAFAGELHAARGVRKADSTALAAFSSPKLGALGRLEEGRLRLDRTVERQPPIPVEHLSAWVPILPAPLGEDGALVDCAVRSGADGLVAVALGAGHLPPPFLDALRGADARIPVVATVRPKRGAILRGTYAFAGSERDLREGRIIPAGGLSSAAARMKLLACLGAGYDRQQTAACFAPDDH